MTKLIGKIQILLYLRTVINKHKEKQFFKLTHFKNERIKRY